MLSQKVLSILCRCIFDFFISLMLELRHKFLLFFSCAIKSDIICDIYNENQNKSFPSIYHTYSIHIFFLSAIYIFSMHLYLYFIHALPSNTPVSVFCINTKYSRICDIHIYFLF